MARLTFASQLRIVLSFVLGVVAAACASPHKKVADRLQTLAEEWKTNVAYQAQLPEKKLDWPAAVDMLRANNLKLRQTRTEVTNAHESVRQVFRDLVPTLNLHAGVSKRITDIPSIASKDVTFSVDSLLNIPGVVSFNARLYMARLYEIRARAAYALAEREQIIELYKVFWAAESAQEQSQFVQNQMKTAHAFETVDPFTAQLMVTETELRGLSGQHDEESLQQRASDLLGSRQYRWLLMTNGLPDLHYDVTPLELTDTNRVAQLQLRLAAIELEAARAELLGIKLRYWPELNIFVTSPPLYQRYSGQERFWDAHDLQASADVYWWIDTRGYISRQVRQTKRQQEVQKIRLRQDGLSLIEKLIFTQDLLKTTVEKERDLEQQLKVMEAVPPAQNLPAMQKYATEYQTTVDQLRQIRREAAELKSVFWFVDEDAWKDLSPSQPLTAKN